MFRKVTVIFRLVFPLVTPDLVTTKYYLIFGKKERSKKVIWNETLTLSSTSTFPPESYKLPDSL